MWKNALTDIDFKPKRKLVPFLGDVENVLYIKIYHYWSHSACRRLWHNINSLRQLEDEQYEDKQHTSYVSAAAGCDGASQG